MSNALVMPEQRVNEYIVCVPLSEALQQTIMQLRHEVHERYRLPLSVVGKPVLTLVSCHAFEQAETRLLERLEQVALRRAPVKVELQNFSCYPSHTVYIQVATRSPFQELVSDLKSVRSLLKVPGHEPHFMSDPQIYLAQKLKPFQFTRIWMDCEHKPFTGRCVASGLSLLKRGPTEHAYEELARFEFASVSQGVKQGTLFG